MISIVSAPDVRYPDGDESYSPSEAYPEYRLGHLATRPNPVYDMVRRLLAQAGLDRERFGSAEWNPLGRYVRPGSTVFVLCNFVYHQRPQDSQQDLFAKCTHGSVLRALADYVLLAAGPEATVRFGNAPLQSCEWDRVLEGSGAARVAEFYAKHKLPVTPLDLRLYVTRRTFMGRVEGIEHRDDHDGVEIDLGEDSLLAELDRPNGRSPRFRVSDYDPDRIEAFHAGRSHRYVIHRAILDSDTIISLPKLKTHEKVGITCGVKGFVGSVGHKDCLAHHRFGDPGIGGDEFPAGSGLVMRPIARYHDWLNRRDPSAPLQGGLQILERNVRRVLRRLGFTIGGAWHGNDTCWRMAVDLGRILHHADREGRMHDEVVRQHLSLIDGITAGEGDGPLAPTPVQAGVLTFGDDVALVDRVACRLMGFDYERIPMIRDAFRAMRYALSPGASGNVEVSVNGQTLDEARVEPVLGRSFRPSAGWRDHLLDRR